MIEVAEKRIGMQQGSESRYAREGGSRARMAGRARPPLLDVQHLLDRSDPRDRLLRESPAVGHRPDHAAVDVDRRAAHPFQDAGAIHRIAAEADQDQVSLGGDVLHQAGDLGVELRDAGALKDRSSLPFHADLQLGIGQDVVGARRQGGRRGEGEKQQERSASTHGT
jgi:hypothetical protein